MTEYKIQAVEPAYVTTDIKINDDGTKDWDTRVTDSAGMGEMPRFYRLIKEEGEELIEIENDYSMAIDLLNLLVNGGVTESEVKSLDSIDLQQVINEREVTP